MKLFPVLAISCAAVVAGVSCTGGPSQTQDRGPEFADTPLDVAHAKFAENRKLIAYIEEKHTLDRYVEAGIARLKAEPDPGIQSQLGLVYISLVNHHLVTKEVARREVTAVKTAATDRAFDRYWDTILMKIGK